MTAYTGTAEALKVCHSSREGAAPPHGTFFFLTPLYTSTLGEHSKKKSHQPAAEYLSTYTARGQTETPHTYLQNRYCESYVGKLDILKAMWKTKLSKIYYNQSHLHHTTFT